MDDKKYNEFIEAVDTVCGECIKRSALTCDTCPVRCTVDFVNDNKLV